MRTYFDAEAPNFAAGLAFNTFLAMFPLVLGMLAIVGVIIHDPGTKSTFEHSITDVFPGDARGQIGDVLEGVRQSAGLLGVLSLVGLLWAGTNLFASMEFVMAQLFGCGRRDPVRQRIMGFLMLFLFIVTIGIEVFANALVALLPDIPYAGFAIGATAMTCLLIAVYRLVPNRTFTLKQIWPGALVAGLLIEAFTLVFPIYARVSRGFNTYGQQFTLFFVLAIWIFFLCQFILAGAVFIRVGSGDPAQRGLLASRRDDTRIKHADEVVTAHTHEMD